MALSTPTTNCLTAALANKAASDELATILNGTVSAAQTFTGGATFTTAGLTITDVDIALGTTTGTKIGTSASQKLGFYNATPIVQPSGASQAAVAGTAATNSSPYGYAQAQADAIVTLVNALRTALLNVGIIKGSA